MDLWPRKAFGGENKFWIKPMDPEREGDAPSLTPSLKEGESEFQAGHDERGGGGAEGPPPAGPIEV